MALRDVLVVSEHTSGSGRVLAYAVGLAKSHGAYLTGAYIKARFNLPAYMRAEISTEALKAGDEAVNALAEKARALFERAVADNDIAEKANWRTISGDPTVAAAALARYADLLVLRLPDPEGTDRNQDIDVGELILGSGRPVLLVPETYDGDTYGRHILVGWNGSREAARAVSDATSLLTAATRVTVACVYPNKELGRAPGDDIVRHLRRHGVRAEARIVDTGDHLAGTALLEQSRSIGADMLVIGGYGRSRLRGMLLGGVTRYILESTHIPVLFAH